MKHRRSMVALAVTAAVGFFAAGSVGTASAASTIKLKGGIVVKLGKYVKDNQRYISPRKKVASGETVTVKNKATTEDPHTITFTTKDLLPGQNFENAFEERLLAAHQVDPNNPEAPPGVFVVDNGQPVPEGGVLNADTPFTTDQDGDSAFIAPGQDFSFRVAADPGSKLFFFCAIHPWMRGKLRVK